MRRSIVIAAVSLVATAFLTLAGCDLFNPTTDVGAIGWSATAGTWRGNDNHVYSVTLAPGGTEYEIYGTDVYTDDSPVGTAAVHAGLVTFASGGTVKIRILPGQSSYSGSLRNGVDSFDSDAWDGSYEFVTN